MLKNDSWQHGDGSGALDGYPIGSVLHLSREFTKLAIELRQRKSVDEGSNRRSDTRTDCQVDCMLTPDSVQLVGGAAAGTAASPLLDSSDALLLLSCYVTLTRICTIVLEHFHSYLYLQPDSAVLNQPVPTDLEPAMCLGELPATNMSYNRIHTAASMLLDSLGQAEAALGITHTSGSVSGRQSLGDYANETSCFPETLVDPDMAIIQDSLSAPGKVSDGSERTLAREDGPVTLVPQRMVPLYE